MRSVLYFHGFASSPASQKITALRPLLEPYGIELNTPDLNVPSFERLDFEAMVAHAVETGRRMPPDAVVGSSLGALVAIAVARAGIAGPLVLIAPALGVVHRWRERFPAGDPVIVYNFARAAEAPIHRAFFEQIEAARLDEEPPPVRVTVLMGRNDETVPFDMVLARWRRWESSGSLVPGSKFVEIGEGDHGLVAHAGAIRDAIVEASN